MEPILLCETLFRALIKGVRLASSFTLVGAPEANVDHCPIQHIEI